MKHKVVKIFELYKVVEGKLKRLKKECPRCGAFMADHKNRFTCGKCKYSEILS